MIDPRGATCFSSSLRRFHKMASKMSQKSQRTCDPLWSSASFLLSFLGFSQTASLVWLVQSTETIFRSYLLDLASRICSSSTLHRERRTPTGWLRQRLSRRLFPSLPNRLFFVLKKKKAKIEKDSNQRSTHAKVRTFYFSIIYFEIFSIVLIVSFFSRFLIQKYHFYSTRLDHVEIYS